MPPTNPRDYRGLSRTTPIPACVISGDELRRLFKELNEKSQEATEKHITAHRDKKPPDISDERWAALTEEVRSRGVLTVIVIGLDGDTLITESAEALSEEKLPDRVATVTFDSANSLQLENITPLNRFKLVLDFTTPGIFGSYNLWEDATPNESRLEITGTDQTWTKGVQEHVLAFFRHRKKPRGLLHTPLAFNAMNWLMGFPVAFWIVFRIGTAYAEQLAGWHVALRGCFYVYVVIVVMALFRGTMHALRWTFPLIELKGSRANGTRGLIVGAIGVLVLAVVYDIAKAIFGLL